MFNLKVFNTDLNKSFLVIAKALGDYQIIEVLPGIKYAAVLLKVDHLKNKAKFDLEKLFADCEHKTYSEKDGYLTGVTEEQVTLLWDRLLKNVNYLKGHLGLFNYSALEIVLQKGDYKNKTRLGWLNTGSVSEFTMNQLHNPDQKIAPDIVSLDEFKEKTAPYRDKPTGNFIRRMLMIRYLLKDYYNDHDYSAQGGANDTAGVMFGIRLPQ